DRQLSLLVAPAALVAKEAPVEVDLGRVVAPPPPATPGGQFPADPNERKSDERGDNGQVAQFLVHPAAVPSGHVTLDEAVCDGRVGHCPGPNGPSVPAGRVPARVAGESAAATFEAHTRAITQSRIMADLRLLEVVFQHDAVAGFARV